MGHVLSSVMSAASGAQQSAAAAIPRKSSPAAPKEDPKEKENRAAYRKLLEKAAAEGRFEYIQQLEPSARKAGVDIKPYLTEAQNPTTAVQIQRGLDQGLASVLGLNVPGQQPTGSGGYPTTQRDARYDVASGQFENPLMGPSAVGAVDMGEAAPPEPQQNRVSGKLEQHLKGLFTDDYVKRLLAKKAGVEIGEHYGEEGEWFRQYGELRKANPQAPASKLIEAMEIQTGWAPDAVVNLKDLSMEERDMQSQNLFFKHMQDPEIDAAIKKLYPKGDHDKVKAGFILNGMMQEGYHVSEKMMPYLERFVGLADDRMAMEAEEAANEVYAKGFAQEKVEAQTFGGKLARETAMTKMKHDINQPRLTKEDRAKFAGAQKLVKRGQSLMETVAGFTGRGDAFKAEQLPTGVAEIWNKYVDKYGNKKLGFLGLSPDENRIKLRTQTAEFYQFIYDMRGKQMSDMEIKLGKQMIAAMDESPEQFIEKFSQFQESVKTGIQADIDAASKAGYDIGDLEIMKNELTAMPNIKDYLQMPEQQAQQTPTLPQGYTFQSDVLTVDPDEYSGFKPGETFKDDGDPNSPVYMYMGNGQVRKVGKAKAAGKQGQSKGNQTRFKINPKTGNITR